MTPFAHSGILLVAGISLLMVSALHQTNTRDEVRAEVAAELRRNLQAELIARCATPGPRQRVLVERMEGRLIFKRFPKDPTSEVLRDRVEEHCQVDLPTSDRGTSD